jgi:hypothetical protein
LIVFCLLRFQDEGQQIMVMLVVNNLWFSGFFFFFGLCSVSFLWFALFLGSVFRPCSVFFQVDFLLFFFFWSIVGYL